GRVLTVVASVVGTPGDPQGLEGQTRALAEAGAVVLPSNAEAARLAALLVRPDLAARLFSEQATGRAELGDAPGAWGRAAPGANAGATTITDRPVDQLLATPPKVVNVGLEGFAEDLARAGVAVVHVDWRPPAGGDPRLRALLERLDDGADDPELGPTQ